MSSCTFTVISDSTVTFYPKLPDTVQYADGRILNKLNLWDNLYVGDAGKSTENIILSGFETDKNVINYFDTIADAGDEMTVTGFGNINLNATWVIESFSYTRDVPGGYSYSLQLEKVR